MTALLALLLLLQDPPGGEFVNSAGMTLLRVAPGEFVMGDGNAPPRSREEWLQRDADESPAHPVTISRAFHLGATEVTCAQYRLFRPTQKGADAEPVTMVTWDDAVAFCAWLSKKENRSYRLPTEAEWEYACRAGTRTPFSTGETLGPEQANVKSAKPAAAGSFPANPWGFRDLHGNVAEWCLDWYGPYEAGPQTDPVGRADGIARVVRGGSFLLGAARYARSSNRSGLLPEDGNRGTGFRVVLGDLPATAPLPAAAPGEPPPVLPPRPVPAAPVFVNYAKDNRHPLMPKDSWGPVFSAWNHFTAICVCPNGDVLAAWYTTVSEEGRELAQASSRLRAGADRWDPVSLFLDVPDVNDHAPVLLSHGGKVYHFFTQSLRGWDEASDCVRVSGDSGRTWSKPRIILPRQDPRRLSQPCSAFVDRDGTLVLACDGDGHRDERVMTSADGGETWTVAAGDLRKTAGRYAIHPAIVPGPDGSILAFMRGPDPLPLLRSKDRGASWELTETTLPGFGVGQKAAALRLASGSILLLSFDEKKKLGVGGVYAALSLDEGKTWPHLKKLEGVSGYLSAAQAPDGMIYGFGSKMSCVAFNEAWIKD